MILSELLSNHDLDCMLTTDVFDIGQSLVWVDVDFTDEGLRKYSNILSLPVEQKPDYYGEKVWCVNCSDDEYIADTVASFVSAVNGWIPDTVWNRLFTELN